MQQDCYRRIHTDNGYEACEMLSRLVQIAFAFGLKRCRNKCCQFLAHRYSFCAQCERSYSDEGDINYFAQSEGVTRNPYCHCGGDYRDRFRSD